MSRIGKEPITILEGANVVIDKNLITVKGKTSELSLNIPKGIKVTQKDNELLVEKERDDKALMKFHGLTRTLINNLIVGVTEGFSKKLEIVGVGYRVEKKGKKLVMNLGYSHPVEMDDPEGITTEAPDQNTIIVKGAKKEQVGNYAAVLRSKRPPENYKGKGIRYSGEYVRKKEGKAGAKAGE